MILPLERGDVDACTACWNRSYSSKFAISPRVLTQHLADGFVDPTDGSFVSFRGPIGAHGWIGAVASPDIGRVEELLSLAEDRLWTAGAERITFGGDVRHVYPGVPVEEKWLIPTLVARGYQVTGMAYDLLAEVGDLPICEWPPGVRRAEPRDYGLVLGFLEAEFAGRWLTDTEHRLKIEESYRWLVLMEEDGEIVAFAHASAEEDRFLSPNLNFALGIGGRVGGIGPIGVAAKRRGTGLGRRMMVAGIEALREDGCGSICIDWTGLLDFYGKFGFLPYTKYVMCELERP